MSTGTAQTSDEVRVKDFSRHGDIHERLALQLGKRYAEYRTCWKLATATEKEFDFPLFLVFETMFRCNLSCIMCIHSSSGKSRYGYSESLPFEAFQKIMQEAASHYCPSLTIGGTSEPMLDRRLADMIRLATDSGFIDTMVNTNATLLTEDIGRRLIEAGLTRLRIGFDGLTAQTYERIRRGADFSKVQNNIINFIRLRDALGSQLPVVRISCVHLSENDREIDDFVEFWTPRVDYVSIQRYKPHEFTDARTREKMGPGAQVVKNITCSQPFERLYIRGNGDVHACCSMVYGPKVGNVFETSLHAIWNSPEMQGLRKALKSGHLENHENCRQCLSSFYG